MNIHFSKTQNIVVAPLQKSPENLSTMSKCDESPKRPLFGGSMENLDTRPTTTNIKWELLRKYECMQLKS